MRTPESRLKNDIKRYLRTENVYWCMIQGGAFSKPGDPDIVACVDGVFLAIEGKTYSGYLSDMQKYRRHQIEAAGGKYVVARSVTDVKEALDEIRQKE